MSRGPKRNTKRRVLWGTGVTGTENRGRGRVRQAAKDKQNRWRSKARVIACDRETEAKSQVLGGSPNHGGSKSLRAGGRSCPHPPRCMSLTRLPRSAAPKDSQVNFQGHAVQPTASSGLAEHRGHGEAADGPAGLPASCTPPVTLRQTHPCPPAGGGAWTGRGLRAPNTF